ncbi:Type-2Aa cytolytic delta-endotoxin [Streptomyces agglomeratus]|uniref:Type-2Aa cytolytic delta-endotoxin n=1 Tax=Streptomyces agglomeratus TaxID=285458 RepID=A0A1E5PFC3_9ACTN|nr:Type-2Aa cytolytic delta-endotoxin [Streptomyces agglomeratus]OEJ28231.1 Type-2Aa cytolytic delta-endotoxin [Streptomyces agglomeratus]
MADQIATEKTTFKTVFEVGSSFTGRARNIEAGFQHAIAPATVGFDFGEISRAASGIPDCSTVKIIRGWGLQETAPVSVMVLSLKEAVRQALPLPSANPAFWDKVEGALTGAFVGLGGQEGTHLSFYREEADRTSYYYNLLFALQDEETGDSLYAVAFCANVTVELGAREVRSLTTGDTARYTIRLNAITVRQVPPSAG